MPAQADAEMAKVRAFLANALKQLVLEINRELRQNGSPGTPVDTGHARANWVPSVGRPFEQEVDGTSGAAASSGIAEVLAFKLGDGWLYVSNNVPYIQQLNRGHSKKAPALFVEQCVARAQATIERKLEVSFGRLEVWNDGGGAAADNLASAYSPFGGDDD